MILALQVILGYVLLGALVTRFAVLFTAGPSTMLRTGRAGGEVFWNLRLLFAGLGVYIF